MRMTGYPLATLREAPSDADTVSARLLIRAGMVRKAAPGLYAWLPLGLRTLRKVEAIVREEMDRAGGHELSLPVLQPKEPLDKTGRWALFGKDLLRVKDRKGAGLCLPASAEELATELARRDLRSWRQLPLMLYRIGPGFSDEPRPRQGVMRAREYLVKDAYSFHLDLDDASRRYDAMLEAYTRIFERCGLRAAPVEALPGATGGERSHEFVAPAEAGEEVVLRCTSCDYAADLDRAECPADGVDAAPDSPSESRAGGLPPLEEVPTPGKTTVAEVAQLLGASPRAFLKTQLYMAGERPVMALVRGDHELNEAKLSNALGGAPIERATERQYETIAGCPVGFAGPVRLPRWKTPEGRMEDVRIVGDEAIRGVADAVSGANKKDAHLTHIHLGRDFSADVFADLRLARPGSPCPRCGAPTESARGIEVAHLFLPGTKYSQAIGAAAMGKEQDSTLLAMGCYRIGLSRVVAAAVEQGHDDFGIRWPAAIAPFAVALVPVEAGDPEVRAEGEKIYAGLWEAGVECLFDDRPERPGVRFKDMDLIGVPYRLVLSKKTLADGQVEFKRRAAGQAERWPLSQAVSRALSLTASDGF
ncbi:MAG: proline--tRNA ligase [Elusimicrobiota bacterium]